MSILSQGERRDGSPQDLGALFGALVRYCAPSAEVFPRPYEPFHSDQVERFDAISVRERLDELALEPQVNDMVDAYWATLCHGALEDVSFAELLRIYALSGYNPVVMSAAVGGFKLRGGTRSLVEAMRQEAAAEVALGAAVAQVRQSDGGVVVETVAGESYTAACAVVAVPLNTLDRVRFEPAISPAKRAAASERHAGRGVKFYAQLRGDLGNVSGFAPGSSPVSWFATQHHGPEGTLIVAFGASPDALAISDRSAVQAALRAFLPEVEVVAVGGWDWNADPFSAGTWCTLRPGQATRYLRELQRPEGRLFFASADWAVGWRGFIDGAIEQGLVAARQVQALLADGASTARGLGNPFVASTLAVASEPEGSAR
jgi:hypothetical protein